MSSARIVPCDWAGHRDPHGHVFVACAVRVHATVGQGTSHQSQGIPVEGPVERAVGVGEGCVFFGDRDFQRQSSNRLRSEPLSLASMIASAVQVLDTPAEPA